MGKLALTILVSLSLITTLTKAQTLTGTFSDVCPDKTYVYTISYPPGSQCSIDPSNILNCSGCYDKSVAPGNNSISLKWSANSTWQLTGKVLCRDPDNMSAPPTSVDLFEVVLPPSNPDEALISCLDESSATWTNYAEDKRIPNTIDCGNTHTWSEIVSYTAYGSSTGYPLNTSLGGGGGNGSDAPPDADGTQTHGLDGDHPSVTLYWASGWSGEVTVKVRYRRRIKHLLNCEWQDMFDLYEQTFYRNPGNPQAIFSAPSNATPDGNVAQMTVSVQKGSSYPGKIYGARYYRGSTLLTETSSCSGNASDLNATLNVNVTTLPPDASNNITLRAEVLDECGTWWDAGNETIHISPACLALVGHETEMKVGVNGGDDSETPNQFLIDNGVNYTLNFTPPPSLPTYTLSKLLKDYTLTSDFGTQGSLSTSTTTFHVDREIGSYQIVFNKLGGRTGCPDISVALRLNGKDWTFDKGGCPIILPEALKDAALDFHLISDAYVFEHFAGIVKSKSYIEVYPGITLTSGAELAIEPGIPQPTGDDEINFVENVSFDEYGRIVSSARSYFDYQGRQTQSQVKNLEADVVLATQTIYDAYGRAAITTLPAPVRVRESSGSVDCAELSDNGLVFDFVDNFITSSSSSSTPYSQANFDLTKESNPDAVSISTPGTLGWYYSVNNGSATGGNAKLNESFTPTTDYPYARTLWLHDGSNLVSGATQPGDAFKAGGGNVPVSDQMPALFNDPILIEYFKLYKIVLNQEPPSLANQFYKIESYDQDENKSVIYSDKDGKALVSVYYGKETSPITKNYNVYDNASHLIVSIPPKGVAALVIGPSSNNYEAIEKTTYKYNHKGWLLSVTEPNTGTIRYMYRRDGKVRFSQNAKQLVTGAYSYTNYDRAGRPVESGEFHPSGSTLHFETGTLTAVLEDVSASGGLTNLPNERRFVISTIYDVKATDIVGDQDAQLLVNLGRNQRFVNGSVSSTRNKNVTTWYSYDEQGRVEWMVQILKDNDLQADEKIKTLDYRYGPSGGLQEIVYQKNVADERFTHFYEYDYNGRLFRTYTSRDLLSYKSTGELSNPDVLMLQSTQFYYKHGPLKRVVYADNIQGIDYLYTVTGALKAINDADHSKDPGADGTDVFGMTLSYYSGDYTTSNEYVPTSAALTETDSYSGLIKGNTWHSPVDGNKTVGYGYTYDARKQLENARWTDLAALPGAYKENVSEYDLNGNIIHLNRNDRLGTSLGSLTYNYSSIPNQLSSITNGGNPFRSYTYDEIGQMTEQVDEITDKSLKPVYDVSVRVTELRDGDDALIAKYEHDDRGFRLSKTTYNGEQEPVFKTWYVRDASGSIVGTYEKNIEAVQPITLTELPIYSGNRIGMYKPQYDLNFYEIQDHLGNVRAVIGGEFTQEYLATMEDSRVNVNAESDFSGITPSSSASFINYTPASVTVNGTEFTPSPRTKVIRVNNGVTHQPIGGGIMLWVHPKDKIDASVHVKYQNFNSSNTTAVTGVASYLATAFGGLAPVVDNVSLFDGVNSKLGVFAPLATVDETQPKAFLTYILYDQYMTPVKAGHVQVTDAAKIPSFAPQFHTHEKLSLDDIEVEQEGFIFIYVSNESDQNMDVYFDDIYVAHTLSNIVAGGDYYPFGLEIQNRTITREEYRHGYQGQYSEKDKESGWNHFQLREYDPVVGRWMSTDPMKQFYSPYIGMGNDPNMSIDEDGGMCCGGRAMEEIYAEAMEQQMINLYDDIKLNGLQLLDEVVVREPSVVEDYFKAMGQYFDPQVYVNVQMKKTITSAGDPNQRLIIPLYGWNYTLDKDGLGTRPILPVSGYYSTKLGPVDFRFNPVSDYRKVAGEDANFRILLDAAGVKLGAIGAAKAQLDLEVSNAGTYLGGRVVGEKTFKGGLSAEINAGVRFKYQPTFLMLTLLPGFHRR